MRTLAALATCALAACALANAGCGSSRSEPLANTSQPPPRTSAAPPPHVEWREGHFETPGLPAVGTQGDAIVVVPMIENDGGRGFANLRLEVHDAHDRITRRIDVMGANAYEALVPDGVQPSPVLEARIEAANHELEALAADHALEPLQQRKAPDLTIDFAAHGWLAPQGQRCPGCPPCENPPYLDAVYESAHVQLVLVRVAYRGTDTCWEPSPQWHVVPR